MSPKSAVLFITFSTLCLLNYLHRQSEHIYMEEVKVAPLFTFPSPASSQRWFLLSVTTIFSNLNQVVLGA